MSDTEGQAASILDDLRSAERWPAALDELVRLSAPQRINKIDGAVCEALLQLLGDPDRTRQRRTADALCRLMPDVTKLSDAVDRALEAPGARLRWGAAYTIGHTRRPPPTTIWPTVLANLAIEDGDQRWAAAQLAGELARRHPKVRREIASKLDEGAPTLRRMLLYVLRDLEDQELVPLAGTRLADDDPGVRLAALAALAPTLPDHPEIQPIADRIAALIESDPEPGVQRAAAATLGRLGIATPRAMEALARAARSTDPGLKRAATASQNRLRETDGKIEPDG